MILLSAHCAACEPAPRPRKLSVEAITLARVVAHSACLRVGAEHLPEDRLDQLEELVFERVCRAFACAARMEPPAAVDATASSTEATGHNGAAGPASNEAGQHGGLVVGERLASCVRTSGLRGRRGEESLVDQRGVSAGEHTRTCPGLAEIDAVAQHVLHPSVCRHAAAARAHSSAFEPVRDRARAFAAGATLEDFCDDAAPGRVDLEPTVVGLDVAEWNGGAPVAAAFVDVPVDRLMPAARDAAAEEVGHIEQLAEQEVGRVVAAEVAPIGADHDTVIGCDERAAGSLDSACDHGAVCEVAAEAVDLRDDDPVERATLDLRDQVFEIGSIVKAAGNVDVLAEVDQLVVAVLDPALDRPTLRGNRQPLVRVAVSLPRYAHVAAESHNASLYGVRRSSEKRGHREEARIAPSFLIGAAA